MAEPKDHITSNVECPRCRCSGHVHVSPRIMTAERHLHYHCTCCRHVRVVRDRRSKERHSEHQPRISRRCRSGWVQYEGFWVGFRSV